MVPVHYKINSSGYQGNGPLTPDQFVAAVNAGIATWAAADQQVRFIYDGTTQEKPGNYNNVVGFDNPALFAGGGAHTDVPQGTANYYGFDIIFSSLATFVWNPCDPAHGQPCTDDPNGNASDLQAIATHEWGHALGLAHAYKEEELQLTMEGAICGGCRFQDTLGLGDILGVRHLYPISAPMPTIYKP
jgi:matrixin